MLGATIPSVRTSVTVTRDSSETVSIVLIRTSVETWPLKLTWASLIHSTTLTSAAKTPPAQTSTMDTIAHVTTGNQETVLTALM